MEPPLPFTGPAGKFTQPLDPTRRLAASDLTKPPETQFPGSQRAPTVGGVCPGHTVAHRCTGLRPLEDELVNADRLPSDTDWHRFDPRLSHPRPQVPDIDAMTRESFASYRQQKDRNPTRVPRAPNTMATDYCEACAFPWADLYGRTRDAWYYTQHPEYRDLNRFPTPATVGWFGYGHEQLDRHSTGQFWASGRHT